jgi:hypothetical protein
VKRVSVKKYWRKFKGVLRLKKLSPPARKLVIGIAGGLVLLAGLAMLILPGPAVVVIPLGLAILASEFPWAKNAFRKARNLFKRAGGQAGSK